MKDRLHTDFETKNERNLKRVQLSRYVRDPSCRVLMNSYAFNDGKVRQWLPAEGEKMPAELREAYTDPEVIKYAFNAPFEMGVCRHVLGLKIDVRQWRCVQVLARSLALPDSLEKVGEVINLPMDQQKVTRSKNLVRLFTMPRVPTKNKPYRWANRFTDPEKWEEFKEYNIQDTVAERAVQRRLERWDLPWEEWELWFDDQDINELGFPINLRVVDNAIKIIDGLRDDRIHEMRQLTGCDNPNSNEQLLDWLIAKGYPFYDLQKAHIKLALERYETDVHRFDWIAYKRVLHLRQEISKTSVKKYPALAAITDDDGYYRHGHQFCGAGRTWRWSGRGFQVHNLLRPIGYLIPYQIEMVRDLEHLDKDMFVFLWDSTREGNEEPTKRHPNVFDVLATCVRPVIQAPDGYVLVDADLSTIEVRVLGWMAQDQKILDVFRKGRDPYIDFATYMYLQPYDELYAEYKSGNKAKRQIAKPPTLACGYLLGPGEEKENPDTGEIEHTGLLGYAWNMGIKMTLKEATRAVKVYRQTFTDVGEFWKAIDKAARKCIRTGMRTYCECFEFDISGPFMRMRLPSGRYLSYCRPKIELCKMPWGEWRPAITYESLNDRNQWVRINTHPGKLTENPDQAIARDILASGIRIAKRRGVDIRIHIHDQIIGLVREDEADKHLAILLDSMKQRPKWGEDILIDAEGSISKIFVKD